MPKPIITPEHKILVEAAIQTRQQAWTNRSVGAALLPADNQVFTGGNVENAAQAFGPNNLKKGGA